MTAADQRAAVEAARLAIGRIRQVLRDVESDLNDLGENLDSIERSAEAGEARALRPDGPGGRWQ